MSSKFASPFMAKSPLRQDDDDKRVKIEKEGKYSKSTEYVRGNREGERGRSVEIKEVNVPKEDINGDKDINSVYRTVRRGNREGDVVRTKRKKISKKRAERIKKRKDKSHKEISE